MTHPTCGLESLVKPALAAYDSYVRENTARQANAPRDTTVDNHCYCNHNLLRRRNAPRTTNNFAGTPVMLPATLTLFHTVNPPPDVTLVDLVQSVFARLRGACGNDERDLAWIALTAIATCRRYERLSGVATTHAMAHRLLVTAMLLAAKATCDGYLSAQDFAFASGITLGELLRLERHLLRAIGYQVPVFRTSPDWDFVHPLVSPLAVFQSRSFSAACDGSDDDDDKAATASSLSASLAVVEPLPDAAKPTAAVVGSSSSTLSD